jgi:5-methylcytosine-specific restriction endonuclease McrA
MNRGSDPRKSRTYKKQRLVVLDRDGWSCHYCGLDATTVDHLIPIIKGGNPLSLDNLVAACKSCNSSKGSRNAPFFLAQKATPLIFRSNISPITSNTVQSGPALGQPEQKYK